MIDPGNEQKLISRLRALGDTTIVLVTHRMAMLALVDRLVVMDRGRVVADGKRDDVLRALAQQQAQGQPQRAPALYRSPGRCLGAGGRCGAGAAGGSAPDGRHQPGRGRPRAG
jgi:ABC-type multidrug transport system ATPase subunit